MHGTTHAQTNTQELYRSTLYSWSNANFFSHTSTAAFTQYCSNLWTVRCPQFPLWWSYTMQPEQPMQSHKLMESHKLEAFNWDTHALASRGVVPTTLGSFYPFRSKQEVAWRDDFPLILKIIWPATTTSLGHRVNYCWNIKHSLNTEINIFQSSEHFPLLWNIQVLSDGERRLSYMMFQACSCTLLALKSLIGSTDVCL